MNGGDAQDPNQAGWVFKPGGSGAPSQTQASNDESGTVSEDSVEWTGSEYVAHQKNAGWYIMLSLVTVAVGLIVYLATRDTVSVGFTVFAGLLVGILAARKPRVMAYRVDQGGLTIGQRYYPYSQFKSFVIVDQGPLTTVMFMPLKRMLPSVDVFVPPDNADAILEVLSTNLPLETRKPKVLESFAHRIRF